MDPVTQGLLGAALPQMLSKEKTIRHATWLGVIGGMAPDLDIFIRSTHDPLLAIQYHRHFTHSLFFIPIGGLIVALVGWLMARRKIRFGEVYLWTTLGYATHALLDACTSYGTMLLWPLDTVRVAWNNVAVLDLFLTVPLGIAVFLAWRKRRPRYALIGLVYVVAYLLLGVVQRERAEALLGDLAVSRGHETATRLTAKPTLFNLVLFRGIYQHGDRFYVDGVRVGLFTGSRIYEGASTPVYRREERLPDLDPASRLARDIDRFEHFSDGYLAVHPNKPEVVGDIRYAMLPSSLVPLWGITIDPSKPDAHVPYDTFRDGANEAGPRFWAFLMNAD